MAVMMEPGWPSMRIFPSATPRSALAKCNGSAAKTLGALQGPSGILQFDQNGAYRSEVGLSKRAAEVISSVYLRADAAFFDRRLKLVGGLRAEQTNVSSEGPLNDPTRNFQRDSAGKPISGTDGRPLPIATDSLGTSRLTYSGPRPQGGEGVSPALPESQRELQPAGNLIIRGSAYTSIGRPDYNQYAGGITLPDTENPPTREIGSR